MKASVTKEGVLIPNQLLGDVKQVEILKEDGRIVVLPLPVSDDPIFGLGQHPVHIGVSDTAEHHDHYLYDNK